MSLLAAVELEGTQSTMGEHDHGDDDDEEMSEYQKGLPFLSWAKINTPTFWWFVTAILVYFIGMGVLLYYLNRNYRPPAKKKRNKMKRPVPKVSSRTAWSRFQSITTAWTDKPFHHGTKSKKYKGPESIELMRDYHD